MSKATIALGVTTFALAVTSAVLYRQLQQARAVIASSPAAAIASTAPPAPQPSAEAVTPATIATLPAAQKVAPPTVPSPATTPAPRPLFGAVPTPPSMEQTREALKDPAQRAAFRQMQIDSFLRRPGLGAALGLNEQQLQRLAELNADAAIQRAENTDGTQMAAIGANLSAAISAEFGADAAAKWNDYQRNLPALMAVNALVGSMAQAQLPLSAEQQQRLTESYSAAFQASRGPPPADPSARDQWALEQMRQRNLRVESEAQAYLSQQQMALLRQRNQQTMELNERMTRPRIVQPQMARGG